MVVGVVLAGAVATGGVLGSGQRIPIQYQNPPGTGVVTSQPIEVHVAGWVISPGVVVVDEDAIVADAIQAAGGLRIGASSDAINLAASVQDGDQIIVPGPDVALAESDDGQVSLNRAGAAELETLPGVGPVLAGKIVAYRDQNGPFQQVEDLLLVPGIGEAKLASIRDLVRVP